MPAIIAPFLGNRCFSVLANGGGDGGAFELLGIDFDNRLTMIIAIRDVASNASWKLRTLMRTQRFYNHAEFVNMFKAHILSRLECRTAAIYHASSSALRPIDRMLPSFLRQTGVSELDAFLHFNFAPLQCRRDVAILGLLHRAALKQGPLQFWEYFAVDPNAHRLRSSRHPLHLRQLLPRHGEPDFDIVRRFALGNIQVYNLLPPSVLACKAGCSFQSELTNRLRARAIQVRLDWTATFSPRSPWTGHPLRSL